MWQGRYVALCSPYLHIAASDGDAAERRWEESVDLRLVTSITTPERAPDGERRREIAIRGQGMEPCLLRAPSEQVAAAWAAALRGAWQECNPTHAAAAAAVGSHTPSSGSSGADVGADSSQQSSGSGQEGAPATATASDAPPALDTGGEPAPAPPQQQEPTPPWSLTHDSGSGAHSDSVTATASPAFKPRSTVARGVQATPPRPLSPMGEGATSPGADVPGWTGSLQPESAFDAAWRTHSSGSLPRQTASRRKDSFDKAHSPSTPAKRPPALDTRHEAAEQRAEAAGRETTQQDAAADPRREKGERRPSRRLLDTLGYRRASEYGLVTGRTPRAATPVSGPPSPSRQAVGTGRMLLSSFAAADAGAGAGPRSPATPPAAAGTRGGSRAGRGLATRLASAYGAAVAISPRHPHYRSTAGRGFEDGVAAGGEAVEVEGAGTHGERQDRVYNVAAAMQTFLSQRALLVPLPRRRRGRDGAAGPPSSLADPGVAQPTPVAVGLPEPARLPAVDRLLAAVGRWEAVARARAACVAAVAGVARSVLAGRVCAVGEGHLLVPSPAGLVLCPYSWPVGMPAPAAAVNACLAGVRGAVGHSGDMPSALEPPPHTESLAGAGPGSAVQDSLCRAVEEVESGAGTASPWTRPAARLIASAARDSDHAPAGPVAQWAARCSDAAAAELGNLPCGAMPPPTSGPVGGEDGHSGVAVVGAAAAFACAVRDEPTAAGWWLTAAASLAAAEASTGAAASTQGHMWHAAVSPASAEAEAVMAQDWPAATSRRVATEVAHWAPPAMAETALAAMGASLPGGCSGKEGGAAHAVASLRAALFAAGSLRAARAVSVQATASTSTAGIAARRIARTSARAVCAAVLALPTAATALRGPLREAWPDVQRLVEEATGSAWAGAAARPVQGAGEGVDELSAEAPLCPPWRRAQGPALAPTDREWLGVSLVAPSVGGWNDPAVAPAAALAAATRGRVRREGKQPHGVDADRATDDEEEEEEEEEDKEEDGRTRVTAWAEVFPSPRLSEPLDVDGPVGGGVRRPVLLLGARVASRVLDALCGPGSSSVPAATLPALVAVVLGEAAAAMGEDAAAGLAAEAWLLAAVRGAAALWAEPGASGSASLGTSTAASVASYAAAEALRAVLVPSVWHSLPTAVTATLAPLRLRARAATHAFVRASADRHRPVAAGPASGGTPPSVADLAWAMQLPTPEDVAGVSDSSPSLRVPAAMRAWAARAVGDSSPAHACTGGAYAALRSLCRAAGESDVAANLPAPTARVTVGAPALRCLARGCQLLAGVHSEASSGPGPVGVVAAAAAAGSTPLPPHVADAAQALCRDRDRHLLLALELPRDWAAVRAEERRMTVSLAWALAGRLARAMRDVAAFALATHTEDAALPALQLVLPAEGAQPADVHSLQHTLQAVAEAVSAPTPGSSAPPPPPPDLAALERSMRDASAALAEARERADGGRALARARAVVGGAVSACASALQACADARRALVAAAHDEACVRAACAEAAPADEGLASLAPGMGWSPHNRRPAPLGESLLAHTPPMGAGADQGVVYPAPEPDVAMRCEAEWARWRGGALDVVPAAALDAPAGGMLAVLAHFMREGGL